MTAQSAAHGITAMTGRIRGITAAVAAGETVHPDALDLALAALVAAVRHHDAEVVRALPYEPGCDTIKDAWKDGQECAVEAITNLIRPEEKSDAFPEVEVRFADGTTIRIARFSVMTASATGLIVVEGSLVSTAGLPPLGDAVRIAHLGIPGRGALADITASVELYTRMEVLNIRIRTTIRPEVTT